MLIRHRFQKSSVNQPCYFIPRPNRPYDASPKDTQYPGPPVQINTTPLCPNAIVADPRHHSVPLLGHLRVGAGSLFFVLALFRRVGGIMGSLQVEAASLRQPLFFISLAASHD